MKITQEEVTHVANLSKLKFSSEETAEFATTLSKIVDMVELLEEVDTTGVAPTTTMADRKTYCVRMLLKKGRTVTACLKMYLKKITTTSRCQLS